MPIQFRQTGCLIEYSEDSGTTWNEVANIEPCVESIIQCQAGEALRCSIATFLTENLNQMYDEILSGAQENASNLAIAGDIIALIGLLGAPFTGGASFDIGGAIAVVLNALGGIAGIDLQDFNDALTEEFYDYVKDKLNCILPDNGSFTNLVLQEWAAEISVFDTENPVYPVVADYVMKFPLQTWERLASIAAARHYPGDCESECEPRCQLFAGTSSGRVLLEPNIDGTYTLTGQEITGGSGGYAGVFGLRYSTYCCKLEVVDGEDEFEYPSAPEIFALVTPCGRGSSIGYVTPQTLNDLNGQCFNTLLIRSEEQFEINVSVSECVTAEWCYTFDFTDSDGGWTQTDIGASYQNGVGWRTIPGYSGRVAYIAKTVDPESTITSVTLEFAFDSTPALPNGYIRYGAVDFQFSGGSPQTSSTEDSADDIVIAIGNGAGGSDGDGPGGTITAVTVMGTGTNPFGEDNCE